MIRSVWANKESFHRVEFEPGFNVVVADRTQEATRTDSRNALGKSTLIAIIDYCLGAQVTTGQGVRSDSLSDWTYSIELDIGGSRITASRSAEESSFVQLRGDLEVLPTETRHSQDRGNYLRTAEWTETLGYLFFGLEATEGYRPTFRSLLPFFVRWGRSAFNSAFEHRSGQLTWQTQVYVAYLVGLEWRHASERQELRDRAKELKAVEGALESGPLGDIVGNAAELEADLVRLDAQISRQRQSLDSFDVLPEYQELEAEANAFTESIHGWTNQNLLDERLLDLYQQRMTEEEDPSPDQITEMYEEAGARLPDAIGRELVEVQAFHRQVSENRRLFLVTEVVRLQAGLERRRQDIAAATERRASILSVLQQGRALDEHARLQERLTTYVAQREAAASRLEAVRRLRNADVELQLSEDLLHQRTLLDFEERRAERVELVRRFAEYTEALYGTPGQLLIDVNRSGFQFKIEMRNIDSQGVGHMAVFCFDLALAATWAGHSQTPGFLIHDSTVFDGVDERQIARSLELAQREADALGFQYICTLNSDLIPWAEFSADFSLEASFRLRLTDATEAGRLLGIRF
jgi:uncharacterized protein YydD (DUF2326 family)